MDDRGPDGTDPVLKRIDAWWTVLLVDPLAAPLARRLRDVRWVTPLGLTLAAHALGVVSAVLFAAGWLVPAAVIFEVRFVLDCADGKLARLRGATSALGAFVDYVGDYLVVGANVVALSIGGHAEGGIPAWLAIAAPAAFLAHIAAGQAAAKQEVQARTRVALFSASMPGGYRAWMARHRLKPLPSRIEMEHAMLFALPLIGGVAGATAPVTAGLWAGLVYFGVQTLHISRLGMRLAADADRDVAR